MEHALDLKKATVHSESDLSAISGFEYERNSMGTGLRRGYGGHDPVSISREDGWGVYFEYDAKRQLTKKTHRDRQRQLAVGVCL